MSVTGRSPRTSARVVLLGALVLCAALVGGLLFLQGLGSGSGSGAASGPGSVAGVASSPTASPTASPTPSRPTSQPSSAGPEAAHTPVSGLLTVAESQLPPQAHDTLELIRDGGPFPHRQDDGTFFNREGILPEQRRGYYREYTVETPGSQDRGARRIVAGRDGDLYYTEDHYDSFEQIVEDQ